MTKPQVCLRNWSYIFPDIRKGYGVEIQPVMKFFAAEFDDWYDNYANAAVYGKEPHVTKQKEFIEKFKVLQSECPKVFVGLPTTTDDESVVYYSVKMLIGYIILDLEALLPLVSEEP